MKKGIFGVLAMSCMTLNVSAATVNVTTEEALKECAKVAGNTCIVENNITASNYISIANGVTIDFGGYTYTVPSSWSFSTGGNGVTLKNGEIIAGYGGLSASNDAKVLLENLKITGSDSLVNINKNANVTIDKNSVITTTGNTNYPAIQMTGEYDKVSGTFVYSPTLHVYGSIISPNEPAILGNGRDINTTKIYVYDGAQITSENDVAFYLPQPCEVSVSGGKITGETAFAIKSGTLNLNGGVITSTNNGRDDIESSNSGIYYNGAVINIDSNKGYSGDVIINISGSTELVSKYKSVIKEVGADTDDTSVVSINVEDGILTSGSGYNTFDVRSITKDKVSVKNGKFNADISEYLVEGLSLKNINGTYVVGANVNIEKVDNGSVSVDKTFASVKEEVTITIKANDGFQLNNLTVVDANNKEINVVNNKFIMPDSDVTIKASFNPYNQIVDIPLIDPSEEVKDIKIGVQNEETAEKIILESANKELSDKIKDTNISVSVQINDLKNDEVNKEILDAIKKEAGSSTIAHFFDISLIVRNTQDNSKIADLENLTKPIELMILLPENLKNTNKDVNRKYYIYREHDGKVEVLDATLSKDGNYLIFKSDKFSTYALGYTDNIITDVSNPKTGDSIIFYLACGVISLIGLGILIKYKKFN